MEFAACGKFGKSFSCSHCDIIQAVVAKYFLQRPDDVLENKPRLRTLCQMHAQFKFEFAGLDQLDTLGLVVLKIENQWRQCHLAYANKRRLASLDLKTAKRRSAEASILVKSNTVTQVIADEGLNLVCEYGQKNSR